MNQPEPPSRPPRHRHPGYRAGQQIHTAHLVNRIRALGINLLGARNAALRSLAGEVPAPLVTEMLGYSYQVAHRHAALAAEPGAGYAADRGQQAKDQGMLRPFCQAWEVNKIPEITSPFWVIKTVITAVCVFWPDYLFDHLGKTATAAVIVLMTGAALAAQFHATRYRAWEFWSATLLVGVAGTEAANGLHLALGTSYVVVATTWSIILVVLLIAWKIRIGTTGLRRVESAPPERFYWGCVLAASAAGTAITHLTPSWLIALPSMQVLLWACAVSACAIASRYLLQLSAPLFWCGFILTRPLGTGCAFIVGGSHHTGALGLGPLLTTVLFALVSVAMVGSAAAGQAAQGNTTEMTSSS